MPLIIADLILIFFLVFVLIMLATALVNIVIRVPYVPSRQRIVKHLVGLAHLKAGEKVYDLGCGDGRFLFEAEKQAKVEAIGFEAAPLPYLIAHFKKWINSSTCKISMRNFFKINLKDADVIFCYLGPEVMAALEPKFKKECRKGTRIYSHTFRMKKMQPTKTWPKNPALKLPSLYLYQI